MKKMLTKPMTHLQTYSIFALLLQKVSSKTIHLKAKLFRQTVDHVEIKTQSNHQKVFITWVTEEEK